MVFAACAVEEPGDEGDDLACETGKCDDLPFADQLKGREDPVGKFLLSLHEKDVIDSSGVFHSERAEGVAPADDANFYGKLVNGIAQVQGCDARSHINYAISDDLISGSTDAIYPRLIGTVCSENTELAANAFVATLGEKLDDGDIAVAELEMFAWDAKKQQYFFYATKEAGEGKLQLEVAPARCEQCHKTHRNVPTLGMPMIPIMNELTKPWTHWNAGEGGVSESFVLPEDLAGKANWELYGTSRVAAASRLEKVIRDANALRIAPARGKLLFRPANLDEAMGLIRPLFCDEQTNYVTELNTGEIAVDAVVAGGVKGAFRAIQGAWPFEWFNNDNIQLAGDVPDDQRLFMMPVRGIADITFEAQLQGVLSPAHILAVRALDWKKPTFSEFRCDLWRDSLEAFQASPPTLSGRNRDAVKVLFEEIMKRGGMSTRGLTSNKFVALEVATTGSVAALREAVSAGTVPTACAEGFCEVDAMAFGQLLQGYVTSIEDPARREELLIERNRRVCATQAEVSPAAGHEAHGPGKVVANEPSFYRHDGTSAVSTLPRDCP